MTEPVLLYGIPNCDTIKKARKWLSEQNIDYQFMDFKKQGVDPEQASRWIRQAGMDTLINKRGTTWRKLTPEQQNIHNEQQALELICSEPSLVKRPVLVSGDILEIGFKPERYQTLFA